MGTKRATIAQQRKAAMRSMCEKIARNNAMLSINQISKQIRDRLSDLVDNPPLSVRDIDWAAVRAVVKRERPRPAQKPRRVQKVGWLRSLSTLGRAMRSKVAVGRS